MKFIFSTSLGDMPVSRETQQQFNSLLVRLEQSGAQLEEISQKQLNALNIEEAQEAAAGLLAGYMSYSVDPFSMFVRKYLLSRSPVPAGSGQAIMRGIFKGTALSRTGEGLCGLLEKRQKFIHSMDCFLSGRDAWLMPSFPVTAFEHKEKMTCGALDDPFKLKIDIDGDQVSLLVAALAYNLLFNFSGHPSVSMPAMFSSDGMPIGLQMVASRWADMSLLRACEGIEQVTGGFRRPPGY